ncbi:MAG: hypothetical protein H0U73_02640 [Tatlockia sp.]|nr:hypothetical protein [Tatlockia sp.]
MSPGIQEGCPKALTTIKVRNPLTALCVKRRQEVKTPEKDFKGIRLKEMPTLSPQLRAMKIPTLQEEGSLILGFSFHLIEVY